MELFARFSKRKAVKRLGMEKTYLRDGDVAKLATPLLSEWQGRYKARRLGVRIRKEINEWGDCVHAHRVYARIAQVGAFFVQRSKCRHCGAVVSESVALLDS